MKEAANYEGSELISLRGSRSSAARSSRSLLPNSLSRCSNSASSFRAASGMRGVIAGGARSVITSPGIVESRVSPKLRICDDEMNLPAVHQRDRRQDNWSPNCRHNDPCGSCDA